MYVHFAVSLISFNDTVLIKMITLLAQCALVDRSIYLHIYVMCLIKTIISVSIHCFSLYDVK